MKAYSFEPDPIIVATSVAVSADAVIATIPLASYGVPLVTGMVAVMDIRATYSRPNGQTVGTGANPAPKMNVEFWRATASGGSPPVDDGLVFLSTVHAGLGDYRVTASINGSGDYEILMENHDPTIPNRSGPMEVLLEIKQHWVVGY